jgi:Cytochrome P450
LAGAEGAVGVDVVVQHDGVAFAALAGAPRFSISPSGSVAPATEPDGEILWISRSAPPSSRAADPRVTVLRSTTWLREGDEVMLFYPSANRDEAVFAAPDTFDVRRDPNPHLAFGFGPHVCLGASLSRLELKVMFREVLARLPDLELAPGEALPLPPSNFVISGAMPVRFTPTPAIATSIA